MEPKVCHYCGIELTRRTQTKDHIIPRALGGLDDPFNIVWSCAPCNQAKADSFPICDCNRCRRARRLYRQKTGH